MDTSLGEFLAKLRQARGVSPTALARLASVSRSSIYNWETGQSLPRVHELETILTVLQASPAQMQQALALLGAPRAERRLRELEGNDIALPHGGDLLRALRVRRSLTQTQVAEALRVSQPTIARWERAEAWPTHELLLRLCYVLSARKAEFAALVPGPFALSGRSANIEESAIPELLELQLAEIERRVQNPAHYLLGDLLYLSLEARALPLARQSETGRILLARILLKHAGYLSVRCQPPEAGRVSEQAMALLPRRGEQWNTLRLSGAMYWAVWKLPIEEHARFLRPWLQRTLPVNSLVWVMGQISSSLMEQKDTEASLDLQRQALSLSVEDSDVATRLRRRNGYAERLLSAGRASEAADMLCVMDSMTPPIKVRTKLTLAEAHLLAGNPSRAHDWLLNAESDNALLGITYYQPQINKLAASI